MKSQKTERQIHYEYARLAQRRKVSAKEIAKTLGVTERTVYRWWKRKSELVPKPGRKRRHSGAEIKSMIRKIRYEKGRPETGVGHCTGADIAGEFGYNLKYGCHLMKHFGS